jgi:hypothetical protein
MTTLYHSRPERWPQFTLRGLFVVVTIAALLMPWAVTEYRAWQARQAVPPMSIFYGFAR